MGEVVHMWPVRAKQHSTASVKQAGGQGPDLGLRNSSFVTLLLMRWSDCVLGFYWVK